MVGGIIIVVLLLVVFPVAIMMSGAVFAVLLGSTTKSAVDSEHQGSEALAVSEANPYAS
jgi:hypothetical protein